VHLNLGSLHYLDEAYSDALDVFEAAERTLAAATRVRTPVELKVYLNLSKTHYELENFDTARTYFSRAQELDADETAGFCYLGSVGETGGARQNQGSNPSSSLMVTKKSRVQNPRQRRFQDRVPCGGDGPQ